MKKQDVKDMAFTALPYSFGTRVVFEKDALMIFDEYKKLKKAIKKHKKGILDRTVLKKEPVDQELWEVLNDN